jgi:hypothetical protein
MLSINAYREAQRLARRANVRLTRRYRQRGTNLRYWQSEVRRLKKVLRDAKNKKLERSARLALERSRLRIAREKAYYTVQINATLYEEKLYKL